MADTIAPPAPAPAPAKGGGLSRKLGPLPVWAWVALAAGGGIVYFLWKRKSAASATGTDNTAADVSANTSDMLSESQYENILAAIHDLQGPASVPPATPNPQPGEGNETPAQEEAEEDAEHHRRRHHHDRKGR